MGEYGKFMFDEEMITWSIDGGGKFFYRPKHKFSVTNVCGYLRTNQRKLRYRYLSSILEFQHQRLSFDYQTKAHPSVIRELYEVPLLPLAEQQKIAEILTTVDEVIENTEAEISKLEDLKKATMNELLTKGISHREFKETEIGRIPKSWEAVSIGSLATVKRGASPRPISDAKWWGGTVGWTRISDVTASKKYLYKTADYLSLEGVQKSVRIPNGEVIMSICATIGRPVIVAADVCIHDGFVWFDGLSDQIDREYFYYCLSSNEAHLSSSRQTGTQGNLNTEIVSRLVIPLPSKVEQKSITNILSQIELAIENISKKGNGAKEMKNALMQDLLTGKVRVKVN